MAKQKNKNTKEIILRAAIDEFIEYGFYGARMQRIADSADVNKAMIHYYFKNKQNIYETALDHVAELIIEKLGKIKDDDSPVEEKISEIMDVYIEIFEKHHDYMRMMIYEVIRGGREARKIIMKKMHRIPFNPATGKVYKYFKRKAKKGEIKKVNIFQLIISIVSQIAPVYFGKAIFRDAAGAIGIEKPVFNKMVKQRKKFVITLIMEGIGKGGKK